MSQRMAQPRDGGWSEFFEYCCSSTSVRHLKRGSLSYSVRFIFKCQYHSPTFFSLLPTLPSVNFLITINRIQKAIYQMKGSQSMDIWVSSTERGGGKMSMMEVMHSHNPCLLPPPSLPAGLTGTVGPSGQDSHGFSGPHCIPLPMVSPPTPLPFVPADLFPQKGGLALSLFHLPTYRSVIMANLLSSTFFRPPKLFTVFFPSPSRF